MLELSTKSDPNAVILDFFAGSGTTGQAVCEMNLKDNGNRRYILVQLPEPIEGKDGNIADLTEERLRRAATKIKTDNPMFSGDTGFRVFKLDTSNIRAWNPDRNNLEQTVLDHQEHLLPNRTQDDVLYEVLLKLGLDLCVPMEELKVNNHTVHAVGGGVLMACFSESIPREDVETLGKAIVNWRKKLQPDGELKVLFRDSAFGDDVAKTNLSEILKQGGFNEVESI
jgi:adenine-specific DNA-methyltransferase